VTTGIGVPAVAVTPEGIPPGSSDPETVSPNRSVVAATVAATTAIPNRRQYTVFTASPFRPIQSPNMPTTFWVATGTWRFTAQRRKADLERPVVVGHSISGSRPR
jgi:hypothetical protein